MTLQALRAKQASLKTELRDLRARRAGTDGYNRNDYTSEHSNRMWAIEDEIDDLREAIFDVMAAGSVSHMHDATGTVGNSIIWDE